MADRPSGCRARPLSRSAGETSFPGFRHDLPTGCITASNSPMHFPIAGRGRSRSSNDSTGAIGFQLLPRPGRRAHFLRGSADVGALPVFEGFAATRLLALLVAGYGPLTRLSSGPENATGFLDPAAFLPWRTSWRTSPDTTLPSWIKDHSYSLS